MKTTFDIVGYTLSIGTFVATAAVVQWLVFALATAF